MEKKNARFERTRLFGRAVDKGEELDEELVVVVGEAPLVGRERGRVELREPFLHRLLEVLHLPQRNEPVRKACNVLNLRLHLEPAFAVSSGGQRKKGEEDERVPREQEYPDELCIRLLGVPQLL